MTGYNEKYGIIKYNNNFYKSYAVFGKDFYRKDITDLIAGKDEKQQIKKFYVPCQNVNLDSDIEKEYKICQKEILKETINKSKIYKHRYYLKVVKSNIEIEEDKKILTFILFNSSYANQFKLDPTIQNCAYLTFKNGYNGFEIFNLFPVRNSVNKLEDSSKYDENIKFIVKKLSKRENLEIILAWGYGNQRKCPQRISLLLSKINNKNFKQISTKQDKSKMMHPDNRGWNRLHKPFKDNAIITDFTQMEIDND